MLTAQIASALGPIYQSGSRSTSGAEPDPLGQALRRTRASRQGRPMPTRSSMFLIDQDRRLRAAQAAVVPLRSSSRRWIGGVRTTLVDRDRSARRSISRSSVAMALAVGERHPRRSRCYGGRAGGAVRPVVRCCSATALVRPRCERDQPLPGMSPCDDSTPDSASAALRASPGPHGTRRRFRHRRRAGIAYAEIGGRTDRAGNLPISADPRSKPGSWSTKPACHGGARRWRSDALGNAVADIRGTRSPGHSPRWTRPTRR